MAFYSELQEEITDELLEELSATGDTISEKAVNAKVKNAIRDAIAARNYPSTYSDNMMNADLCKNLVSIISELALYDINTIGSEGETAHTENGVTRQYKGRDSILGRIIPFAKVS